MLTLLAAVAVSVGSMTAACAVEFDVGPGGVRLGPGYHRDHDYRDDGRGGYGRQCRLVICSHVNRYDEEVTVRRRICD